jgi:hypothetical protein
VDIGRADARAHAVQFRLLPPDREGDLGAEQSVEVVRVPRVFAEVTHVDQNPPAKALLYPRIVLDIRQEREYARRYLNTDGSGIHWVFIRALLASVADTVLIPFQDVLGLGSEARMNQPATLAGNWRWRYRPEMLDPDAARRLKELTELYARG